MRRLRLRPRITLALLLLALLPLALTTIAVLRLTTGMLERNVREYAMAVSDEALRVVRTVLDRAGAELQAVGVALADPDADAEQRLSTVRARLLSGRYVRRVALYDRQGRFVDALRDASEPELVPRPAALDAALCGRLAGSGWTILGVVFPPGGQAPRLQLATALSQGDPPTRFGYLWSSVPLEALGQEMAAMTRRRFGSSDRGGQVFLIDDQLRLLTQADRQLLGHAVGDRGFTADLGASSAALRAGVSYAAEYEVRGRTVLGVLVPFADLGWGAVVEQDRDEAYAGVRRTLATTVGLGLAAAIAAVLIGLWLGGRLAGPVLAVAAGAREVAAGRFQARVPVVPGDEVGQLAESFNAMADDLQQYERRLIEETALRTNLGRYLPTEVVDAIVAGRLHLELGGERREVTVLFADVVAFTRIAEQRSPEQAVALLNELFTVLAEIVFRHGGIVDKFLGDCIMAVFGVPEARPDTVGPALAAAEEMLTWLEAGNAKWSRELGHELQLGIGIGSGPVVAGNLGSNKRMEYTVIGDAVNLAARLEHLARPGQVLLCPQTAALAPAEFEVRSLGQHALGSRSAPVEFFELVLG